MSQFGPRRFRRCRSPSEVHAESDPSDEAPGVAALLPPSLDLGEIARHKVISEVAAGPEYRSGDLEGLAWCTTVAEAQGHEGAGPESRGLVGYHEPRTYVSIEAAIVVRSVASSVEPDGQALSQHQIGIEANVVGIPF